MRVQWCCATDALFLLTLRGVHELNMEECLMWTSRTGPHKPSMKRKMANCTRHLTSSPHHFRVSPLITDPARASKPGPLHSKQRSTTPPNRFWLLDTSGNRLENDTRLWINKRGQVVYECYLWNGWRGVVTMTDTLLLLLILSTKYLLLLLLRAYY